ncbi:MAG: hypothetical protein ACR2P0_14045 [Acidimicrobiales bacterium]
MMWKHLRLLGALLAVALIAAACGSSLTDSGAQDPPTTTAAPTNEPETSEMADDTDHDHDHDHDHDLLEVEPGDPVPEVEIELNETDSLGSFTLIVELTNFSITPDAIDADPIANEGHMHLLIDGEKVERFTDLERVIDVPNGEHLVEVELNGNDHRAWTLDGEPIRAGVTITSDASGKTPVVSDDAAADITITASYADGVVSIDGDERVEVPLGSSVAITLTSDVADEIHAHGYDLNEDVAAGESVTLEFVADVPGRFEVELEQARKLLVELLVS